MVILYLLALLTLLMGTTGLYMTLIQAFPLKLLYYNNTYGRPVIWLIFLGSLAWALSPLSPESVFFASMIPVGIMGLSVVLSYKVQQESFFVAVDYPETTSDPLALPLTDDMQIAVIEYGGVTRAYVLDYVKLHHIINDKFGDHIVSLTYCAMCRSVIPFDVTDLGPLFVASFKNANMIVGDRKTRTYFQQATFESVIGSRHPYTLTMIPFQILLWGDVKKLKNMPMVAHVAAADLVPFELPVPGIWSKIMASEATPGMKASRRDTSFPARTHVVGLVDAATREDIVYLKEELLDQGAVHNADLQFFLIATHDTVNGFRDSLNAGNLQLELVDDSIVDTATNTVWDLRGQRISGELTSNLEPVAISDEYWFSWKAFHPETRLIRV